MALDQDTIYFNSKEAFAAYSLPGIQEHILIKGKVSKKLPKKGGFIIQGFNKQHYSPRIIASDFKGINTKFNFEPLEETKISSTPKAIYLDYAAKTIDSIQSGHFDKVVISKVKLIPRKGQNLYETFNTLKNKYLNAFVFAYHIPGDGFWMGASPELLLKKENNKYLTMALAGTQRDLSINLDAVRWGNKEVEEHAIIERFVEEILSLKNADFIKSGPKTIKAGNVLHIQSIYEFEYASDIFSLIDQLHPGPAICGVPRQAAISYITKTEQHNREHYCGYLGPWKLHGKKELFVNLRSMRVFKNNYALYLGGGLTRDSEAAKEWEETEMKAKTLTSVVNKAISV